MKLENCSSYAPGLYNDYATEYEYAGVYDFNNKTACAVDRACLPKFAGSEGQTLQTVYKHANNICTYAESPAYACGDY